MVLERSSISTLMHVCYQYHKKLGSVAVCCALLKLTVSGYSFGVLLCICNLKVS